jgi:hypothetical protein
MSHIKNIILVLLLAGYLFGCDEELPPKNDPTNFISGHMTNVYRYSPSQNGIYVMAYIANNYDETISGTVAFGGTLTLEWVVPRELLGNSSAIRTVHLSRSNIDIIHAKNYNAVKNELIFQPHDTVQIGYLWDFKFDDGSDARNIYAFWQGQKNIGCGNYVGLNETPRMVYPSHEFKVNFQLQLFEKLGFIYLPEFTVNTCTINFYPNIPCNGMAAPKFDESPCGLR